LWRREHGTGVVGGEEKGGHTRSERDIQEHFGHLEESSVNKRGIGASGSIEVSEDTS
jgi:hypothetical protein